MVLWEWVCVRFREELTAPGSRSSWGCKPGWECPEWAWGIKIAPFPAAGVAAGRGKASLWISLARDELQRGRAAAAEEGDLGSKEWGKKKNTPGDEVTVAPEWGRKLVVIPCPQKERLCVLARSSARVQTSV